MSEDVSQYPPHVIRAFFHALNEENLVVVALSCAYQLEGVSRIRNGRGAKKWLENYISDELTPRLRFGRVISLMAILDFELSHFALSRNVVTQEMIAEMGDERLAKTAREMLSTKIPALRKLVDAWQALRENELDEASLWVFRDAMQAQARGEIGEFLDKLARRSESPKE